MIKFRPLISIILAFGIILVPLAQARADGWITTRERVDIMLIVAHPDDDQLFLGGVIPTYVNQGKKVVTVYMTFTPDSRRGKEALNGLMTVGERQYPVFGRFEDIYRSTTELRAVWTESRVQAFLIEQIRKYQPSVIVTQDVNGEYGHMAHKWMVAQVRKVFTMSGNPAKYPESAEKYKAWNPLKLYIHMYPCYKHNINTRIPLARFNGKTAFQMAQLGFACHSSQNGGMHMVSDSNKYSIRLFGLEQSRIGFINRTNNMMEGVTQEALHKWNPKVFPNPKPAPSATTPQWRVPHATESTKATESD